MVTEPFLSFSYDCPECGRAVGAGCSVFMLDGLNCCCGCGRSSLKAKLYDNLKQKLFHQYADNRGSYTAGKQELISALLKEAAQYKMPNQ